MATDWESELAALLNDLMSVQDELLAFLAEKRQMLVQMDVTRLDELEVAGEQLIARLQSCHDRRGEMLVRAASESRPADSLRTLAKSLPAAQRAQVESRVAEAAKRAQLLKHQSFANWVFVQRSLIHLARLLEIIATGGRSEPTYGREESLRSGGSLVDQAA
jgi:hypothetical protein